MKIIFFATCFFAIPAFSETRLDLYSGKVICGIEQVCLTGKLCTPNNQSLREIVLTFSSDGDVIVDAGIREPIRAFVISPRPSSTDIKWWHLAWMSYAPNTLQIGFKNEFTWIEGSPELLGFAAAPPIIRTGHCKVRN